MLFVDYRRQTCQLKVQSAAEHHFNGRNGNPVRHARDQLHKLLWQKANTEEPIHVDLRAGGLCEAPELALLLCMFSKASLVIYEEQQLDANGNTAHIANTFHCPVLKQALCQPFSAGY